LIQSAPWPIWSRTTREAIDAVGFLGALRHAPLEREPLRCVTPGCDDRPGRDEHARTWNDALIHRLLELDVSVLRALGAEIPDGREAGEECLAQMVGGTGDAQREAFVRDLVVPGRLAIGVQQHMRMAFDEPGRERRARQIDDRRACDRRACDCVSRSDRVDPIEVDAHGPPVVYRVAVEDACRLQDDARALRGAASRQSEREQAGERQQYPSHFDWTRSIIALSRCRSPH
jgi:hypothetical protein